MLHVRLLGTAAGGGLPQWNCNCPNCQSARHQSSSSVLSRTQSSIAISADRARWFLINASPDVRVQMQATPQLWPKGDRARVAAPIEGVLLTSADLDHTLGLFSFREATTRPLAIHAPPLVRRSLCEGLNLENVLASYCGTQWHEPSPEMTPLCCADGSPSGIEYSAVPVPGKPPRYRDAIAPGGTHVVAYVFRDPLTRRRLVIMSDLAAIDEAAKRVMTQADLVLLDGTFFDAEELRRVDPRAPSAAEMGHLPVGGPQGSLAAIAALASVRRVYIHINNTNPMLHPDSPQRRQVQSAGVIIGEDGMEFDL